MEDNQITPPKISTLDLLKYKLGYFQGKSKVVTTVVGIAVMAGVSAFVAFASLNRSNISLNPDSTTGAANPSCYLSLNIKTPTPPISPPILSCGSACKVEGSPCGNGLMCLTGVCRNPNCSTSSTCTCSPSTPTPTPRIVQCSNCQYQIDLFHGPVINSFAGGVRYSSGAGRLIASRTEYVKFPGCNLKPVSAIPAPTYTLSSDCSNPVGKGYLVPGVGQYYFDNTYVNAPKGYMKASIKNASLNCTYNIGLASYSANGSNIDIQNLFDYQSRLLGPGQTATLYIKTPMLVDAPSCHQIP